MRGFMLMVSVLTAATLGCSGSPTMIPVTGLVRIGNQPARDVIVYFWPDSSDPENFATRHAMGQTDAGGHFVLKCSRGGVDGIEGGHYHVTFSRPLTPEGSTVPGFVKHEQSESSESIPVPYSDHAKPGSSPCTAEVSSSNHEFEFDLPAK